MGVYSAQEFAMITDIGQRASAHAATRGRPLDVDWEQWIPTHTGIPELAADWRQ